MNNSPRKKGLRRWCLYILAGVVLLIFSGLFHRYSQQPKRVYREHADIVLEEFEHLKKLVLNSFGDESFRNFMKKLPKLATYHYNKRKYILLGEDRNFYNFLIENSYNPFRVYRWALLEKVPEEIKFQLKQGMMSQKMASKIHFKRRNESRSKVCMDIKLMGLNLVRSM